MSSISFYVVVLHMLIQLNSFELQFCNQYSVPKDKLDHFKNITAQDIVCSQVHVSPSLTHLSWLLLSDLSETNNYSVSNLPCLQITSKVLLKEEDVAVSNVKIDLTRGKDNPLERFLMLEHPSDSPCYSFTCIYYA